MYILLVETENCGGEVMLSRTSSVVTQSGRCAYSVCFLWSSHLQSPVSKRYLCHACIGFNRHVMFTALRDWCDVFCSMCYHMCDSRLTNGMNRYRFMLRWYRLDTQIKHKDFIRAIHIVWSIVGDRKEGMQ